MGELLYVEHQTEISLISGRLFGRKTVKTSMTPILFVIMTVPEFWMFQYRILHCLTPDDFTSEVDKSFRKLIFQCELNWSGENYK